MHDPLSNQKLLKEDSIRIEFITKIKGISDGELQSLLDRLVDDKSFSLVDVVYLVELEERGNFPSESNYKKHQPRLDMAVNAFRKLGSLAIVSLLDDIKTGNTSVKIFAKSALGHIGKSSTELIISHLSEYSGLERKMLTRTLSDITGKHFFTGNDNAEKWEKWWSKNKSQFQTT